jgi:hypothetical protein
MHTIVLLFTAEIATAYRLNAIWWPLPLVLQGRVCVLAL